MRVFDDARSPVAALAFSPDGGTLTACYRGAVQLVHWDLPTGAFRRWHPQLDGPATACGYSPDGAWLAVGGESGLTLPVRTADLTAPWELRGERGSCVDAVAFAPAGGPRRDWLAVASDQVRLYDLVGKTEWHVELPGRWKFYRSLAWSPDGTTLASCNVAKVVTVWDVATRELIAYHDDLPVQPTAVAFAPDGRTLAVADGRGVTLYRAGGRERAGRLPTDGPVLRVAYHPTRPVLATAGADGAVRLWDGGAEARALDARTGGLTALAWAPDGLTLAAGGETGKVVVWDVDG